MKVSRSNPLIKRALAVTFPEYRGRTISVEQYVRPVFLQTTWSEGSRDFVKAISLREGRVGQATNFRGYGAAEEVECPEGAILVVHSISCGRDAGVTFYVRPEQTPLLSEGAES